MPDGAPILWPIAKLLRAYRSRELSPVEVAQIALRRIEIVDPQLNAFLTVTPELALEQARAAEAAYGRGENGRLLGIPVSIKDAFHVAGVPTTFGSLIHRTDIADHDSLLVRRIRCAGALIVGKTNTAEFGQSATTDNRLRADARNPWDPMRTPGGSSGGAAASVAAGLATVAVGSDGGGSIRIPAAFTGVFGLKPTPGLCPDEGGLRAMSDFVSPGPLAWRAGDARILLEVMSNTSMPRRARSALRIAWCARPEGRPVDPEVAAATEAAVAALQELGHTVTPADLPLSGWDAIFGPLVLDEERRERGHLLGTRADELTRYERRTLRAAARVSRATVERARRALEQYRARVAAVFEDFDLLCTPSVAVPAFPVGRRPRTIDGEPVDVLWGAFPFAVPFNVALTTAASVPCGVVERLPVGLQLVGPSGADATILDLAERLEDRLDFSPSTVHERWADNALAQGAAA